MYQNIARPRFYINTLEWLNANDSLSLTDKSYFRTLPITKTIIDRSDTNPGGVGFWQSNNTTPNKVFNNQSFFAILGLGGVKDAGGLEDTSFSPGSDTYGWFGANGDILVNCDDSGGDSFLFRQNGFAIGSFNGDGYEDIGFRFNGGFTFGSIVLGTYYDLPHSPNISLNITRNYDGINKITTYNGSSITNEMGNIQPMWLKAINQWGYEGNLLGAWQTQTGAWNQNFSPMSGDPMSAGIRLGRKSWDLTFSYINDEDLFPAYSSLLRYGTVEDWEDVTEDTILTSQDFFSQVWHKTLGGILPFIFQPDRSNFNHDQFCIAKFTENSLTVTRTALNVYDISISIEEVW